MRELQQRAIDARKFGAAKRWARFAAMATFALMVAACGYQSEVALHHPSEAVRPPHLIVDSWDGDCQRDLYEESGDYTQYCLFEILDHPEWLVLRQFTVRQTGESSPYLYTAMPRRALNTARTYDDVRDALLIPSESDSFVYRRDLDRALGSLVLMYEAVNHLSAAERCRLSYQGALAFKRPKRWGCESR